MIYRMEVPIEGALYMLEDERDDDMEVASLNSHDMCAYKREIQKWLQEPGNASGKINEESLYEGLPQQIKHNVDKTAFSFQGKQGELYGRIDFSVRQPFSQAEREQFCESLEKVFKKGWGEDFLYGEQIPVETGYLQMWIDNQILIQLKETKYEVTKISHPKYPWLHRIRALKQVNEQVREGMLGGYVQTEDNLSQDETCWIYDQAIACEGALVTKDGRMYDGTMARDSALVSGNIRMFECSRAEGHSCLLSGELKENARAAGEAVINQADTGMSPLVGRNSSVYGTVCGAFIIHDNICPGEKLVNDTRDMFILEDGKWSILVKQRKLEPPEEYQKEKNKRKDRER